MFNRQLFDRTVNRCKTISLDSSEESTKMQLVIPMLMALGHDAFNRDEVMPEYKSNANGAIDTAVDYAIIIDNKAEIIIEVRRIGEPLYNHVTQLKNYFRLTRAKVAILTNGVNYWFFKASDEWDEMDVLPYFNISLVEATENDIKKLGLYSKDKLEKYKNIDKIIELTLYEAMNIEEENKVYGQTKESSSNTDMINESIEMPSIRHRASRERLYHTWFSMIAHCYKTNNSEYKRYGAVGIGVCYQWRNDYSNFRAWAYNNGYSDNLLLGRKDKSKDYSPENCMWETRAEKNKNRKDALMVEYNGENIFVKDLAEKLGKNYSKLRYHIKSGKTIEESLKLS